MRLTHCAPAKPIGANPWSGWESISCDIEVITPLLGGGAKPGEQEAAFAVRPSAIRGHLRSWWRILFGSGTSHCKDEENAIWGSIQRPSYVIVQTAPLNKGEPKDPPFSVSDIQNYAAYPAKQNQWKWLKEGFRFQFTAHLDNRLTVIQKEQAKKTIQAWLLLGCVGARGRRGLGAIQVIGNPDLLNSPLGTRQVQVFQKKEETKALLAWKEVVADYRSIRKSGRNGPPPKIKPLQPPINVKVPGKNSERVTIPIIVRPLCVSPLELAPNAIGGMSKFKPSFVILPTYQDQGHVLQAWLRNSDYEEIAI